MGSSQAPQIYKDPSIKVFIILGKTFYYAGEMVQGVVHVQCLANRPSHQLLVRLQGKERVYWSQFNNDNSSNNHGETRETYNQVMPFHRFPKGIRKGQFSFPFSLLLPAALPASFEADPYNFIKYTLSTIFVPTHNQSSQSSIYQKPLHIREPPRLSQGQMSFRVQQYVPIYCCCWMCCPLCLECMECCECDNLQLTLQSDVSVLTPGQNFRVFGRINISGGNTEVQGFKIILNELVKMTTKEGSSSEVCLNRFSLHINKQFIPSGSNHQFDLHLIAPIQGLKYTAIGNIIYRAYFLELEVDLGGCYTNTCIKRHVIVNSDIEPADNYPGVQAPEGWNPQLAPFVTFYNLQTYIYRPNMVIDVRNQVGMPIQDRNINRSPFANLAL